MWKTSDFSSLPSMDPVRQKMGCLGGVYAAVLAFLRRLRPYLLLVAQEEVLPVQVRVRVRVLLLRVAVVLP
jgi:hypothetical protein